VDKTVKAAIEWCNEIREKNGQEPVSDLPKGRIRDPDTCPCGQLTGTKVFEEVYFERAEIKGTMRRLPQEVTDFVRKFDRGEYPQYIKEGD
jgi:hypothetical protein